MWGRNNQSTTWRTLVFPLPLIPTRRFRDSFNDIDFDREPYRFLMMMRRSLMG